MTKKAKGLYLGVWPCTECGVRIHPGLPAECPHDETAVNPVKARVEAIEQRLAKVATDEQKLLSYSEERADLFTHAEDDLRWLLDELYHVLRVNEANAKRLEGATRRISQLRAKKRELYEDCVSLSILAERYIEATKDEPVAPLEKIKEKYGL